MSANPSKVEIPVKLLDIVIINWNSVLQLTECLDSMFQNNAPEDVSVFVVDNSSDAGQTQFHTHPALVELVNPGRNLGFGGGCNLGAAQGNAPFILFLNPDIYFFSDTLTKLLAFLKSGKLPDSAGIAGVQLVNLDGSIQKNVARFPEFKDLFPRMLGLDRLLPGLFKPHYARDMDYTQSQFVDQVPGAFFLIKRPVFEQMGGFDKRFFMYYEDVDLSYRAHLAGWKSYYLAEIAVKHIGGGTTASIQGRRLFYSMRSRILYVGKHFGILKAGLVLLGILLLEFPVRLIRSLLRLSMLDLFNTIKALALLLINFPAMFKTYEK